MAISDTVSSLLSNSYSTSDCYKTSSYTYPIDLITKNDEYGKSYVIFYINVAEDSRAISGGEEVITSGVTRDLKSNISGLSIPVGEFRNTMKNLTGISLSDEIKASKYSDYITPVTDYIGDVADYFFGSSDNLFSKAQKRLKTAIALHLPNDLSISYSTQWNDVSTDILSAIMTGSDSVVRALSGLSNQSSNTTETQSSTGSLAGEILGSLALQQFPSASPSLGLARNPKKEQQFSGVEFRTFVFNYVFTPRNEKEAENIQNIIYMFKYHMHPEYKSEYGFIYMYPSEFDIEYYFNDEINDKIHKHTSCVLTDMQLDYTNSQGVMTLFPNGMPTTIRMSLQFKELLQLTKETIALGT
jgi:uncharacterized protein YrzB (UPF0473 family)